MIEYACLYSALMCVMAPAAIDDGGASAAMKAAVSETTTGTGGCRRIAADVIEHVPDGYDPAAIPSLILVEEFADGEPLGSGAENPLCPVYGHDAQGNNTVTVALDGTVSLYGTGEVQGSLLRNGTSTDLWNTDNYTYKIPGRLYQSHPWVLGVNSDGSAFGLIFDTPARSSITTDDDRIVFTTPAAAPRVYLLTGDTPQAVLRTLGRITGNMEMPPRWALGYHQCRFSYYPDTRVKEIADTFRLKQIPCDVIWMDIDYMDGYRIFTFDEERFPDPEGLNKYLHDNGFKAVYMIDPGIKVDENYPLYTDGRDRDMYVRDAYRREYHGSVWPGPCAFPDYTRPEVRSWWADLYKPFMAKGIDGIWNDMNEPSVMDGPGGTMPTTNIHLGGGNLPTANHLTYHNAYGRLMVEASRDGILAANPDKRPFVLSRANLLGGQRFAATWTGDNAGNEEHMRMSIPMTLNLSLSGQPFNGPDLGGFADNTSGELFGEWMGFGAFFPFARGHACNGTNQKEPWVFGKQVERECRIALQRRYRLIPYYYTLFHRAATDGQPVMAPVFFADPSDPDLRAEEQAFLIGDDLLVVPSMAVDPVLPKGIWREVSLVKGDRRGRYQARLLTRGGSIIPLGEPVQNLEEEVLSPLTLLVTPDADGRASGTLYWDAGDGFGYKDGDYALIHFEATTDGCGHVSVKETSREGTYPLDLTGMRVQVVK